MRRLFFIGMGLVFALYLLPAVWSRADMADTPVLFPVPQAAPEESGQTTSAQSGPSTVTVELDGKPTVLPLETYVEGVVAAEIAASFPVEAIRAQAVAARTYAVYKLGRGRPAAHPEADLCDDYRHCAAYRDAAAAAAAGGDLSRVRQAVQDTAGQILTYEGAPIAGATQKAYSIVNAQVENSGVYRMDAFDESGRMLVSMDISARVIGGGIPQSGDSSVPVGAAAAVFALAAGAFALLLRRRARA